MNRFVRSGLLLIVTLSMTALHAIDVVIVALFQGKAAIQVNGKQSVLSEGESVDGVKLISSNSEQAVLEVNGQRITQQLGSSVGFTQGERKSTKRSVTIRADEQGMYRVNGKINNRRVEFLVDTGATLVAISRSQADSLKLDYDDAAPTKATTAGGEIDGFQITLKKIKVGGIVIRNVEAVVLDGDYPPQPLLGNSFLNSVEMTRRQKKLILTAE